MDLRRGRGCGAFPTTEASAPITVDGDRTDLLTGFAPDVGTASTGGGAGAAGFSRHLGGAPAGDR